MEHVNAAKASSRSEQWPAAAYHRPTYRMYVDEVGSVELGPSIDPNARYLSLTGVILSLEVVRKHLAPEFERLKRTYIEPDTSVRVIFHRSEIVRRRGIFEVLRNKGVREAFDADLMAVLEAVPFTVITVVMDKREHLATYGARAHHPYHYCMEILLERYVLWMEDSNNDGRGDVMAESRGAEDRALKTAFRELHMSGNRFVSHERIASRVTSREIKLCKKSDDEAGLQLADLVAHPSFRAMKARRNNEPTRNDFGTRIANLLERAKYRRAPWGAIDSAGRKWLPK